MSIDKTNSLLIYCSNCRKILYFDGKPVYSKIGLDDKFHDYCSEECLNAKQN